MTKSELIEILARKQNQLPYKDVELAVKTLLEQMSQSLATGNRIEIRGFGSYKVKKKNARQARNPKTGEHVFVPEHYVPTFKFSKEFKEMVNDGMMQNEHEAAI